MKPIEQQTLLQAGETPALPKDRILPRWICAAALIVAMALLGMRFGWPWYRQLRAKEHFEALGGAVTCREPPSWLRSVVGQKIAPKMFDTVVTIDLDARSVDDRDLLWLRDLPELEALSLAGTQVSHTGLIPLRDLHRLRDLRLPGRALSNETILELRDLRHLEILWIDGTTELTLTGAERLKEHLPGLSIYW